MIDTDTLLRFRYSGTDIAELRAHDGHTCTIVRPLTIDEASAEVGPMYRIRFEDGAEHDAFGDELEPVRNVPKEDA